MKSDRNVPFDQVQIHMGFWQKRQRVNREVTAEAVMNRFMETGRFEAMKCEWRKGMEKKPHIFWDSDIAKWIEGVAYLLEEGPEPALEQVVEQTIDVIEANQCRDGYFNSYFISVEPSERWSRRRAHELYCAGHLMEAAIAWQHATGRDRFLRIMCRYADYIDRVFRVENSAEFMTPGHEEIELALMKLYQATGERRYLELSSFFIRMRGCNEKDIENDHEIAFRYSQSHLPCHEQFTAEGHAVRACYLYAGMADVARECKDEAMKNACQRLFDNIVNRRMYLTGGVGSTHQQEAFTVDYDLPNATAYAETCAAIALCYFAGRMQRIDPDSKYADAVERALFNGFLSGVSLSGREFFYTNPLEINLGKRRLDGPGVKMDWLPATQRVEVFSCSCCPPNVVRFVASVGNFMYTENDERVYMHQYMGSKANIGEAEIEVETEYPVCGEIRIRAKGLAGRKLCLRVPGWCQAFTLNVPHRLEQGYAVCEAGDGMEILLTLDMTPQLVEANPEVSDDAGKVAVQRGPVVYCAEGVDNGERLHDVMIDAQAAFEERDGGLFLVPVLETEAWQREAWTKETLYRRFRPSLQKKKLTLIPYFAFANRGESDMYVWFPVRE